MGSYFDVLKALIGTGTRTLRDIESRIAYGVAGGHLTPEEANELTELAESQSAPPDLPGESEVAVRLGTVEASLALLTTRVATLEAGETGGEDDEPEGPPEGVEAWNAATSYRYGDVRWHNGSTWISLVGNNKGLEPGVVAYAWRAV